MPPPAAGRRAALLTAAGLAAALAGCVGDDDDPADDGEAADAEIAAARERLTEAGAVLESGEEAEIEDVRAAREAVEDAQAALDEAGNAANAEQTTRIARLQRVASWIQRGLLARESFALWETRFALAFTHFRESEYGDALDELERADANLESAESNRSNAVSAYADLDEAELDALEDFDHAGVAAWLEVELREGIASARSLTDGFFALVPAFQEMTAALEAFEAEDWATAETHFADARDRFTLAENTFREAEEAGPAEGIVDFAELEDIAATLKLAAAHFHAATLAAQEGDWDRFEEESETAGTYLGGDVPGD